MLGCRGSAGSPTAEPQHGPGTLEVAGAAKPKAHELSSEKLQAAKQGETSVNHFPGQVVALLPAAEARAGGGAWKLPNLGENWAGTVAGQEVHCRSLGCWDAAAGGHPVLAGWQEQGRAAGRQQGHWGHGTLSLHGGTKGETWSWGAGTPWGSRQEGSRAGSRHLPSSTAQCVLPAQHAAGLWIHRGWRLAPAGETFRVQTPSVEIREEDCIGVEPSFGTHQLNLSPMHLPWSRMLLWYKSTKKR